MSVWPGADTGNVQVEQSLARRTAYEAALAEIWVDMGDRDSELGGCMVGLEGKVA